LCSACLAYFHTNRLLIELYKQEMEIRCRKEDNKVKKQTDIDRHGPKPSSNSSQPPDPPYFSLPTTGTFNKSHKLPVSSLINAVHDLLVPVSLRATMIQPTAS